MSLKSPYAAPFGNIVLANQGWYSPLGGIDATGQPGIIGITTAAKATVTLTFDTNPTDGDTFTIGTTAYRMKSTMAQAYDVKIHASDLAITLDYIKAAINQSGTAGTEYYTGTLAHPLVEATTNGATTQVFRARNAGTLGNLIASTETFTDAGNVFSAATLTGGTDAALKVDATISATAESTAEATAAAPTYTEGQDAPLSQDLKGGLRVSSLTRQYAGVPSNFTVGTSNDTVFTLAAGEVGFIQNLDDAALAVKKGASASTSSFSFILAAGNAADDGRGGLAEINDWVGAVSVAAMSGTARYIAWKQAAV